MAKTPKPMTVSAQAKALDISPRRCSQLRADGMPHTLAESRLWRRERAEKPTDYLIARARKMAADAERSEIILQQQRGELISRAEATAWQHGVAFMLQAMLRKFEGEVPQLLLGLPLEKSRPTLKKFVREIQQAVADKDKQFWGDHLERQARDFPRSDDK